MNKFNYSQSYKCSEKFQCELCLKFFGSKSGMLSHKRQFHIESVASRLEFLNKVYTICLICNIKIVQSNLNSHSSVFKCSTCQSTCFSEIGLQRHIVKMHSELVNHCPFILLNILFTLAL